MNSNIYIKVLLMFIFDFSQNTVKESIQNRKKYMFFLLHDHKVFNEKKMSFEKPLLMKMLRTEIFTESFASFSEFS